MELSGEAAGAIDLRAFKGGGYDEALARRRDAILDGAVRCLLVSSPRDIQTGDIAKAAGISRRTLYRVYETKNAIIVDVLFFRMTEVGRKVRQELDECETLAEALLRGTSVTLKTIEADPVMSVIVADEPSLVADAAVMTGTMAILSDTWSRTFEEGRARGELRDDISDAQGQRWLMDFHYLLAVRPDIDREEAMTTFLLPSLLSPR